MRKHLITFGLALSVSLILLSLLVPVNHSILLPSHAGAKVVADGTPIPPVPPPPPPQPNVTIADGTPIPPTPPPPIKNFRTTDNWKSALA